MQKRSVFLKIFAILVLAMGLFHFSGIEIAFCKDGIETSQSASHGCVQCHSGHHAVSLTASASMSQIPALDFLQLSHIFLKHESPALGFLRPPIFS
jgi:hypothetical protein